MSRRRREFVVATDFFGTHLVPHHTSKEVQSSDSSKKGHFTNSEVYWYKQFSWHRDHDFEPPPPPLLLLEGLERGISAVVLGSS